jgi:hypothetical protein
MSFEGQVRSKQKIISPSSFDLLFKPEDGNKIEQETSMKQAANTAKLALQLEDG